MGIPEVIEYTTKTKQSNQCFQPKKNSFWLKIVISVKCQNGSFLDSRSTLSGIVYAAKKIYDSIFSQKWNYASKVGDTEKFSPFFRDK